MKTSVFEQSERPLSGKAVICRVGRPVLGSYQRDLQYGDGLRRPC